MRFRFLFLVVMCWWQAFAESNSDSAFTTLNIFPVFKDKEKPVADASVEISFDISPLTIIGYTDENGWVSFSIPKNTNCVYLYISKFNKCNLLKCSGRDTIKIISSAIISDTIVFSSWIWEKIGYQYPEFYFSKNGSAIKPETDNNRSSRARPG